MNVTIERPSLVDVHDYQTREATSSGGKTPMFGESGPSFGDLLDVVNPLQHLPVIGTIYRALTGDGISDGARLAGGALYGGPVGLVLAMANVGMREATGQDFGDTALAALTGEEAAPVDEAAPVKLAAASPEPEPARALAPPPATPASLAAVEPTAGRDLPQLSPDAFDALLRSVNGPAAGPAAAQAAGVPLVAAPAAQAKSFEVAARQAAWRRPNSAASGPVAMPPVVRAAARPGLPAVNPAALDALSGGPAAVPALGAPGTRQAGLELHDALRQYARQRGVAAAP